MGSRWNRAGFLFTIILCYILLWGTQECLSLNDEGLNLLAFRERITSDPYGALENWSSEDSNPCIWSGVHCADGKVQKLNLSNLSLEGNLVAELGNLNSLENLVLCKNKFFGTIPKELGYLSKLELLDLRENNFTGTIPAEIVWMLSLKHLLIYGNKFDGSTKLEIENLRLHSESSDDNLVSAIATGAGYMNRKFRLCMCPSNLKQWIKVDSFIIPIKGAFTRYLNAFPLTMFKLGKNTPSQRGETCSGNLTSLSEPCLVHNGQTHFNIKRRKLLEKSSNLAAVPVSGGPTPEIISLPTSRSSGALPAVPNAKKNESQAPAPGPQPAVTFPPDPSNDRGLSTHTPSSSDGNQAIQQPSAGGASGKLWKYVIIALGVIVFLIVALFIFCLLKRQGATTIRPWKTGISGQLQKAFVTGVPKLNRSELETACEDFSNIISTVDGCTMYKGTLSSGVEIAVCSTLANSSKEWSNTMEMEYHKKVDTLSKVNHKNFVNLIGYCKEEEPFTRMLVFEYAPNGTLFEHLHVKEVEHLDWSARMRIIMGTAYCLQYMHHDLNPPVAHTNLTSAKILLTDDFAAKIAEITFGPNGASPTCPGEEAVGHSDLPPVADPVANVFSFGVLLLEIISGRLHWSKEQGKLVEWASEYLNDKQSIGNLIDPTLKFFENDELDVICEVIQGCIQSDPRLRPIMKDVTSKLNEVLTISPDQANPRLSPLWWAELEILSGEAT